MSVAPKAQILFAKHLATERLTPSSLTQATDTSNIRLVFAAVKDTILHNALADSGIL